MSIILWSLDSLDWKGREAEIVTQRIAVASDGMIVLMHEIHETTVAAISAVVEYLSSRVICFVTMTELVGSPGLMPGRFATWGAALG